MRCKPGDLAIVVHSGAGNEGRIVRVLKLVGVGYRLSPEHHAMHDGWLCHGPRLRGTNLLGEKLMFDDAVFPDEWLRPLPGDMKEDETEREKELVE